jgi:hypothetical protein
MIELFALRYHGFRARRGVDQPDSEADGSPHSRGAVRPSFASSLTLLERQRAQDRANQDNADDAAGLHHKTGCRYIDPVAALIPFDRQDNKRS